MYTYSEYIEDEKELTELCKKVVSCELNEYVAMLFLEDDSWIEITASHEDGAVFIEHSRKVT